jgi:hypothetical protein
MITNFSEYLKYYPALPRTVLVMKNAARRVVRLKAALFDE